MIVLIFYKKKICRKTCYQYISIRITFYHVFSILLHMPRVLYDISYNIRKKTEARGEDKNETGTNGFYQILLTR